MAVDKEVVLEQIKALGRFDNFGTKKEVNHLHEIMGPGETIKALCSGLMDGNTWLCTVTDKRIILLDVGMFTGLNQVELPVSQIKSVSHKMGFLLGEILIDTGGQTKTLKNVAKSEAPKIAAVISQLMHQKSAVSTHQAAPDATTTADLIDQLERLAALKERGILTEAEFSQQKAKLLDGGD